MPPLRVEFIDGIPRQHWTRLAWSYLALGAAAWWSGPAVDVDAWWVHGLWCAAGLIVAIPTLLLAFRSGFADVLTDHRVVFLAAFALYFLFGAALPAFGPELQVENSLRLYPTDVSGALRVDAVNGLGVGVALLISGLSQGRWLGRQAERVAGQAGRVPHYVVVGLFLAIGIGATAYRIPFDLGVRPGVVSGVVRTLGQLSLVAIFMAASSRGAHEWFIRWLGVILAGVLAMVGVAQFMKAEALLPLVALTAGMALRFRSRWVLPVGLALIVTLFMLLGNLVNYGRSVVALSSGTATLTERWAYLKEGLSGASEIPEGLEYPYWSRLCYVPTQVASIDFQNEGSGGNGLRLMWWAFVPRFLAPNKPQMTAMFAELNEKITGSDTSANAPGVFVSGYYHGGWWGVWLASAVCGWILAQTSAIARAIHAHQAAAMVPFSLLGMFIAFRIDGDFIPDYLGVFMFILYPLLAAALVLSVAAAGQGSQSGQPEGTEQ